MKVSWRYSHSGTPVEAHNPVHDFAQPAHWHDLAPVSHEENHRMIGDAPPGPLEKPGYRLEWVVAAQDMDLL